MPPQIDGVTASVNPDQPEKAKKPIKKTVKKRVVKKKSSVTPKISKKEKSSFTHVLISIIVTAVVVGGSIYGVQKVIMDNNVNQVKQEKNNLQNSLEAKLNDLTSKLTGAESDKSVLEKEKNNLQDILAGAILNYSNSDLGLNFSYPATFGQVNLIISNGDSGKFFTGSFSDNKKVVFGGVSKDFQSSGPNTFLNTQGFRKRSNQYYYKTLGEDPVLYKIKPMTTLKIPNNEILIVDQSSFATSTPEEIAVSPGNGNLGALVNLNGDDFKGVAFWDQDITTLPLDKFEAMLKTVEIK